MKTAKKIFKIVGIILGIIILALIGYIIYLFASYHRIEDNLPLEVESHAADANLQQKKNIPRLHIISDLVHIHRISASLWTVASFLGEEQRQCAKNGSRGRRARCFL